MDVNNSYFVCQEYSYFFDTFTIQNAFTMYTPAYFVRLRADLPNQIETHSNNRLIFQKKNLVNYYGINIFIESFESKFDRDDEFNLMNSLWLRGKKMHVIRQ